MRTQENIKITIVVPIYGVEHYIHKCLQSIDQQTYPSLEVILVNDCTKDQSMQVVDNFLRNESVRPEMYCVINHETNEGLSEARNTGLRAAKGDYVYFLDSDDYISDNCMERLAQLALCYEVDIVFGNIVRIRRGQEFLSMFNTENRVYDRTEILDLYAAGTLYREAPNKLLRKSYLITHDLFFEPGMLNEDVNWTFRMLAYPFTAALLDAPTYYYVQEREGSIMSTVSFRNYEASIKNLEIVDEVIEKLNLVDDKPYIKYYVTMIQFTIWFLFYHKCSWHERKLLYAKLRQKGIDYKRYYKKCGIVISLENFHFFIRNIALAYFAFETYNVWRRIKGRLHYE